MKKFLPLFAMLLSATIAFAQSPESFNYQGVARDNAGNVLAGQPIALRLSILSGSIVGATEYSETHSVTTNAFGLFNVAIGNGTPAFGSFSVVDWGANSHYVKVEMDPAGGTAYQSMGTSQLLSVPYALYAENSGTGGPTGPTGATGADGTQWTTGTGSAPWPADEGDLFYNTSTGDVSQVISESWTIIGNIMGSSGATGPTGATGPLTAGTFGQTLWHNGTDWAPTSNLYNDGTNVGIGMSTPGEKLDVNGNIALRGSGRSILSPNGALNISSVSGIDIIIDDDNNSTNSTFKVKRNSDGVETIFEAKENGNVEVEGEYEYSSAKTHYKSYVWSSFVSPKPGTYLFGQSSGSINNHYGVFVGGSSTSLGYAYAPIHLPDGATITEMKAWYYDNLTDGLVRVRISAQTLGTDDATPVSPYFESDDPTASTNIIENTTPTSIIIDNSTKAYYIEFTGKQDSDGTRLYGVLLTYTVDQAD